MGDTAFASSAVVNELKQLNHLFITACDQINLLNQEIRGLDVRFNRAKRDNKKAFLYSLRIRLSTLEAIVIVFLEYAQQKADNIDKIQEELREENRRVPNRN